MNVRFATAALFALVAFATCGASAPAIGTFDIKPVTITLHSGESSASVEITNDGGAAQELEIGVRTWAQSDGSADGEPTDDIVASPSIFVVPPGGTQLVRLGPTRELGGDVERSYRLVATEVPASDARETVQAILRMRMPIFIMPRTITAPPLIWHVARTDAAQFTVSARNDGNVHRRIRSLRVTSGGRVVYDNVVAAYVLAHQSREWVVRQKASALEAPIEVRATEMDGATQEASFMLR